MQNVKISRYARPLDCGWAGWIEPEDRSWIVFIDLQGMPVFFLSRDPKTGAICPDDPTARERHIAELRGEENHPRSGNHTGEKNDGSADYGPDGKDPHDLGEVIPPIGVTGAAGYYKLEAWQAANLKKD